jgi:hypothetical protein
MEHTASGARVAYPLKAAKVRPRDRRNGFSIHGYTGINGGGKTLAAVYDSLPTLAAGRPVVSTCRILDPRTGEPHPLWVPLDDWRMLLELELCDVIMDEVTGIAGARDAMGLPSAIQNHLNQLRKDDVTLRWTTPNWRRADTIIREVTQALTTCVGFMPRAETVMTDDGIPRRWKQRRAFLWRTYDAQKFEEWSSTKERSPSKANRIRPVARQLLWGPGSPTLDMYDTYEVALTLGVVSEKGLCMDCGGRRPAKACVCAKQGSPVQDPSLGMLRWRRVNEQRKLGEDPREEAQPDDGSDYSWLYEPKHLHIPETDDTPGVVVETAAAG